MADTLLGAVTTKGAAKDEREAKRNPKWILHFAVASNCFTIKVFSPWQISFHCPTIDLGAKKEEDGRAKW
jgi:hypothetical protein